MFSGIKTPKELEISPLLSLNKNQSTCLGLRQSTRSFVEVPTPRCNCKLSKEEAKSGILTQ
jgi:hypothetical protein